MVQLLGWVANVDAFQHWIYEDPQHTKEERTKAWTEIYQRFGGQFLDWSGLEKFREMKARGYLLIGLDSTGDADLADIELSAPLALVLGAEGKGLRQLTRATCDRVARLDLPGKIKSLNVSNAAALALYVASRRLAAS